MKRWDKGNPGRGDRQRPSDENTHVMFKKLKIVQSGGSMAIGERSSGNEAGGEAKGRITACLVSHLGKLTMIPRTREICRDGGVSARRNMFRDVLKAHAGYYVELGMEVSKRDQ